MIDLHCHSTCSDGTDTPETLAALADEAGLTALALTDHDTVAGLPRLMACQPTTRCRLLPGIELSCRFLGSEMHVLGLLFDPLDAQLLERVEALRVRRIARNTALLDRLRTLGVPLEWEDVLALAPGDQVSRAHFARALVKKGIVCKPQDAFHRYIGEGAPAYVPFKDLTPGDAAGWIREAGGVALVAHPGRTSRRLFPWDGAMKDLKAQGFVGFEARYSDYGPAEQAYFEALARDLDMLPSGGSDYHGAFKPGIRLGVGRGDLEVPDAWLENLEAAARCGR